MTSLSSMNAATLSQTLGREISDAVVLVAKSVILGGDESTIADALGVTRQDVLELMETQDYKDSFLILSSHYQNQSISTDLTYDDIESKALQLIAKKLDRETDPDRLLRIATMANKAIRRNKPQAAQLDPSQVGQRVHLTLSKRIIEKLQGTNVERTEVQEISIKGRNLNPSFQDVDEFFGVKKPRIAENYQLPNEQVIDLEQIGRELSGKS